MKRKKQTVEYFTRQLLIKQKKEKRRASTNIYSIVFPRNLTKKFLIIYLIIITIIIIFIAVYLTGAQSSVTKKVWSEEAYNIFLSVSGVIVALLLIYPLTYKLRKKRYIKKIQNNNEKQ